MNINTYLNLTYVTLIVFGLVIILSLKKNKQKKLNFIQNNNQKKNNINKNYSVIASSLMQSTTETQEKFHEAGIESIELAKYYMPLKYIISIVLGLGIYFAFITFGYSNEILISVLAVWIILSIITPDRLLEKRRLARRKQISSRLPYLLDMMAVCVQAGMTIEGVIRHLSIEFISFDTLMAKQLDKIYKRSELVGLDIALDEFYQRFDTSEVRSFVVTLKQSLQFGSSIYPVLVELSSDLRALNLLDAEEKIGQLSAKMSVPLILFIMLPITVIVVAPAVMRLTNAFN
ncbi:TPA: type II secretion system F family protein [Vibrio vulnificus]|nr:type II secretion system F family protein [Vibrio vulnificus]